MSTKDSGHWSVTTRCTKRHSAEEGPYEILVVEDNLLLTAGATRMLLLLTGAGLPGYSASTARMGVGNGNTAPAVSDTDLSAAAGSTNRYFRPMDAGFPVVAGNVITFQATWGDTEGLFTWLEWGIDNGGPTASAVVGAPLLNRRVPPTGLGTKTGGLWTLATTIQIT